jgi:hypothetical protein
MLFVGELAVRRISKFENTAPASARGAKLNFGRTSRIQVSCGTCLQVCCIYEPFFMFTVATCRTQHVQHRGFCEEPPR